MCWLILRAINSQIGAIKKYLPFPQSWFKIWAVTVSQTLGYLRVPRLQFYDLFTMRQHQLCHSSRCRH